MKKEIDAIVDNARTRFATWLDRYTPWHGENGITERNLSFQFATAFLDINPDGLAFMEVPFAATEGGPLRNHLDAYFHCDRYDLLLECKVVNAETGIHAIAGDIIRLWHRTLHDQICRSHQYATPKKTHGVVLAETWYPKIAKWWKGGDSVELNWSRKGLPQDWFYETVEVYHLKAEQEWTLYWLYAVSPELAVEI